MKADVAFILLFCLLVTAIPMTAVKGAAPLDADSITTVSQPPSSPEEASASPSASPSQTPSPAEDEPVAAIPTYAGGPDTFQILNKTTGAVDTVDAFDYIRGAIAAEMPAEYHPEALKAQGVAAYTYAVMVAEQNRQNPPPELDGADFEADPENRKVYMTETQARDFYGDMFDVYWDKMTTAAEEAARYILLYEDAPVVAAYHAISTGQTEDSGNIWDQSLPYLTMVDSEGDMLAAGYESVETFSSAQLADILTTAYPEAALPEDRGQWIQITERSPSGYVTQVDIGGVTLSGMALRTLLDLRSSCFDVDLQGGTFTFTVSGYGHGAGLSQYGADYMARQGSGFQDILAHYYPGTTLALREGGL